MRVTKIERLPDRGGAPRSRTLARFRLEVADGVRLHGLTLLRRPDGSHHFHSAHIAGANVSSFAPDYAAQVVQAAVAAFYGEPEAHDQASA